LAEWSEYQESPKKESRHERHARQAAKAHARRKKALQKSFEVLASMPVGFTGGDENSSETSSTSTHFKRKKSKKNDVDHRPVIRSLTSSGSSCLLRIEGGPSHVEQVLATNEGQTIEEQMAQLIAILQQKEDQLAALRQQIAVLQQQEDELATLHRQAAASQQRENELAVLRQQVAASNERQRNEVNATMSKNSHQSESATISLEAIQRMIAEGSKLSLYKHTIPCGQGM
jgi:hypothetical protein